MSSDGKVKILGFCGSLRSASFSRAVLSTVQAQSKDKSSFEIFNLSEIPLYNEELDGDNMPGVVRRFKEAIAGADGLVISTPEYNYGISGVLKNAIDWASRPGYKSVLKDKPVLMIASSVSFTGGVRALGQLRQTLAATLSRVVPVPEIVIADVANKVHEGHLTDETSLRYISQGVDALIDDVRKLK